eukprot:485434_1
MSTYTWKITDPSLIRSMKNAKNGAKWKSPIFSIGGLRWRLCVHPNGYSNDDNGHVQLFLYLTFLPPKVKSIQVERELQLIETDTIKSAYNRYDKDNMNWGWPFKTLRIKRIESLTTLTFSAKIEIYGVIDHEDNDISNQYTNTNDEESKH